MAILMKAVPSSEKCFWDEDFEKKPLFTKGSVLGGEEFFYEIAYTSTSPEHSPKATLHLAIDSPIAELVSVETVEQVPVRVPCYQGAKDDNYLRTTPGLYPDLLMPVAPGEQIFVPYGELKSLFVTVRVPAGYPAGEYPVAVKFVWGDEVFAESVVTIRVIGADLPKQEIKVTEWFHTDCIASYYELETFSEKHWEYIENFMRTAVENGINTILMPVFTPPLDTAVGGERPTTQLVDVYRTESGWEFGFDKVERWVRMCDKVGVEFFEVSHLYTQWGAGHAPKIVGYVNGERKKLFGWETDSLSDEYRTFLRAFLTAFLAKMKSLNGADKRCLFHISDEPGFDHLEQYTKVKAQIADILEGYPIMDALSDFEFYKTGVLSNPIPCNNHIDKFIEANVPNLWTYYCCGQCVDVSNRFIAMPMERTRVIGTQFWKYNIAGFLQWGYNFWYSQYSISKINPYLVTDGNYFYPAGDGFAVYPGENGKPLTTLHMKAFTQALYDLRAMKLAEALCGREAVLAAMEEGLDYGVTFSRYPTESDYCEKLREKINAMIADAK